MLVPLLLFRGVCMLITAAYLLSNFELSKGIDDEWTLEAMKGLADDSML